MSFMCKIEVGPKREECKKGGWCTGCQKIFEVGPRREKCEKGGGCEKGGCEAVPHLGAKKNFRALRARTHLKKILNTPLIRDKTFPLKRQLEGGGCLKPLCQNLLFRKEFLI